MARLTYIVDCCTFSVSMALKASHKSNRVVSLSPLKAVHGCAFHISEQQKHLFSCASIIPQAAFCSLCNSLLDKSHHLWICRRFPLEYMQFSSHRQTLWCPAQLLYVLLNVYKNHYF